MAGGMDFFGHQERARRATGRLIVLFALALLAIWLCVHFAASALLTFADERTGWFRPEVLLVTGLATFTVVGSGMLWKTAQLAKGGSSVALLLGGKPVPIDADDPKERLLRNVVEEMAIASGVPVPEVFVLDNEAGINAFAAGWSSADAAVAVTRGCLEQFDRDELQGVIAHEFSHVFHGDMRLNIRLMGVLFGIVCITTIGRIVVETIGRGARGSSGKGKGGVAGVVLFGVALIAIGWLGVLFARLIQAAVSRHREFLADASAVQYTRNPRGIGLALAKLGNVGSRLGSVHAEETGHMLFGDGMRRFFGGAFATHPPIEERVERVLPGFRRRLAASGSFVEAAASTPLRPEVAGLAGGIGPVIGVAKPAAEPEPVRVGADALLASIGDPQPEQVDAAREFLRSLPLEIAIATREPRRAAALVYALLLDGDAAAREAQRAHLERIDTATAHETLVLYRVLGGMASHVRLPLLEVTMPALRALPPVERAELRANARVLAKSDGRLLPFEFSMLQLLDRHVRLADEPPARPTGRPTSLSQHAGPVALVLSALAHVGSGDSAAAAQEAFSRGAAHLGVPQPLALCASTDCGMEALEVAVRELRRVSPAGKRNLLSACAVAAGSDGTLTIGEADLLRALAGLWDCPIPIVAGAKAMVSA